jgi:hypothetical protein
LRDQDSTFVLATNSARLARLTADTRPKGLRGAISAGPVELAECLHAVRVDLHGSASIVLHDLVACCLSSSTNDVGLSRSLLDGNGIFADILEPNVVEVARSEAVHPLGLVSTDYDVSKRSTRSNRVVEEKQVYAYCRVPPDWIRKTASESPPSAWSVQAPEPRSNRTLPPKSYDVSSCKKTSPGS